MPASPDEPSRAPLRFAALAPPGEPVALQTLLDGLQPRAGAASPPPPAQPPQPPSPSPPPPPPQRLPRTNGAAGRPYTILNMVSTADGRATLGGVSGGIGDSADKQLFHGLRTVVDAVMAGAGTMRAEGYRRLVRDQAGSAARRARGLAEQPLACVVSGRLALDERVPLLADPAARVAVLTASRRSLPDSCAAQIEYVRCARDGELDLTAAFAELRGRFGVRTLLCEGGPHLNAHLLAAGLVDELFLSLAPTLAGGADAGESLRILAGADLDPPVAMRLISVHEHESQLFLRYRIH